MQSRSLLESFRYSFAGIAYVLRTERNATVHVVCAVIAVSLGIYLRLPARDWAILAMTIGSVWGAEIINTVVEAIVDLLTPEYHERAKVAKDVASGAVLVLAATSVVVGLCILGPPLWERLSAG